ncbi:FadR/GntR family transcriptional regulator [Rhodococcus sp. JVH1]|uniref:FadR/GntR family transcriptional regulator n=1 Tax=Rhodococcus sp. JVH1 TaxID=745408 RepID=UPI000272134F|nr:GntR family transcriptional regulator [Rhodococcus sp. JVH1]EJI95749.1 transcriptional regulator, GntR family [Rhodococcus sp. JVH1]
MTRFQATPTRQARLYEDVADQLREAVLTGQFKTGDKLPTETELAAQFGVSRAVVRQATLNLEHEGLVTVLVGASGGTFVRAPDPLPLLRALENHFRHRGVSLDDFLQAKRILEPSVLGEIVRFSDRGHRAKLQENIDRFEAAIDGGVSPEELLTLSLDFHDILIEATGNPVLQVLLVALVRMGERVPEFTQIHIHNQDWKHILAEHRAILATLEDNNLREFRTLMLEHLESVQHLYGDPEAQRDSDQGGKTQYA